MGRARPHRRRGHRRARRRREAQHGSFELVRDSVRKSDVTIAKNYLDGEELDALNRIVTAYLEFAELQATNRKPMYMADWIRKLDDFLRLSEREILTHAGRVSHEAAVARAESEYHRFAAIRATLPTPVDLHFAEAVRQIDQLDRTRPKPFKKTSRTRPT